MTARARWLLLCTLFVLAVGTVRSQALLQWFSLSVFVWFLVYWFEFQYRVNYQLPRLHLQRTILGNTVQAVDRRARRTSVSEVPELSCKHTGTLWTNRKVQVQIVVRSSWPILPILSLRDTLPELLEALPQGKGVREEVGKFREKLGRRILPRTSPSGAWQKWFLPPFFGPKTPTSHQLANECEIESRCSEAVFSYAIVPRAAGQANLPGVRLTLQDRSGFFLHHRFVELPQSFRCLPDFFQAAELRPTIKRHNSLPRHGIHRVRSAGAGSELLELREYVPGDPPKSIAWKVSARREQLMTRKYESEVPVRVHFLVGASRSTRIGGFGLRMLDQMNFVVASIAKAATAVGDPISGTLVDETRVQKLKWLSGDRGFLDLLQSLSTFSSVPPPAAKLLTQRLMQDGLKWANERYPELLDHRFNRVGFSLFSARRQRQRLCNLIAEVFQLTPMEHAKCLFDDSSLTAHIQRLLFDAGNAWMPPLVPSGYGDLGVQVDGAQAMLSLATAITRATARAHDNEVFVILADPAICEPNLDLVLRQIKLALAKHHRVAFVCPSATFSRPDSGPIRAASDSIRDLLVAAEDARVRDMAVHMKRSLTRLGVTFSFSGQKDAIDMVLAEIEIARDGRSRRRSKAPARDLNHG